MQKILLVEDESTLQKSINEALSGEGFETVLAVDGEEGLRLAQSSKPDLILLDLILPKMDGFEVLKALKGDEQTKNIPVIVLTNLEDMADIQRALELGATTYLVKANYSLQEVVEKVKQALK